DLERLLVDREVAELVLEDDGHFLGILGAQALRHAYPRRTGVEGNIEMMIARQAALGGVLQHPAQHRAQRLLRQQVVAYVVDRHGGCHPRITMNLTLGAPNASESLLATRV